LVDELTPLTHVRDQTASGWILTHPIAASI